MNEEIENEEIEEEKEYTPEELGIDTDFNYFDDNKDVIYYGIGTDHERKWIIA